MQTKCPATMCPLIAPNGSIWTGEKDSPCPKMPPQENGQGCGFWYNGCLAASECQVQIDDFKMHGHTLQLGYTTKEKPIKKGTTYDCARASECQWQQEAGESLCGPRKALFEGIDPKVTLF